LVSSNVFPLPAVFEALEKMNAEQEKIIMATLSGMFKYLKSLLKFDYIMSAVRFAFYEMEGSALTMVLDSQALQHLEIFETPLGEKGSLFEKIDRTKTKFGKRLFRRWMMQPLLDPLKINQRLDAV
jgi:DNA mismatch repair ATPase MutS